MTPRSFRLATALSLLALAAPWAAARAASGAPERVVSIGGGVTEIAYAVGGGPRVVATDTSSLYPKAATELPQVGYQRTLSAEGVLAQRPDLVLLSEDAGPPAAIAQLAASGVKLVRVTNGHSLEAARERVTTIANALERPEGAKPVLAALDRETRGPLARAKAMKVHPKVLFVFAHGPNAVSVAGEDTAGDAMIKLAGGANAMKGFSGYKPLTAEAVVTSAPELVVLTSIGHASLGGDAKILSLPGLALTPAGKAKRVLALDDIEFLTFGPRMGHALGALNAALVKIQAP